MAAPFYKGGAFVRKLMWFGIGFAMACACAAYLLTGQWILLLALVCLPAIALFRIRSQLAKRLAVLLLGCAVGFAWCYGYDALYLDNARQYDCQVLQLNIEASDYAVATDYGCKGTGYVHLADREYPVQYYLNEQEDIAPGDYLLGKFQIYLTTPAAQQESMTKSAKGIYLVLYSQDEPMLLESSETPVRYWGAVARRQITDLVDELFPSDVLGFVRALLLGDRSQIRDSELRNLKISGICHIIATSGLHVAILLSVVYLVTGEFSRWTALLGIPVMIVFAAVSGFSPSVVRACLMQSLMLISYSVNKEYDPPTALAFAVLTMLLINPMSITSVSLQLSVACVAGIILFSGRISGYLLQEKRLGSGKGKTLKAKFIRFVAASLSVSLSTTITTAPLCAYYFGTVSLVSILTNFLTLWVISFVFYGIIIALIAGAIWQPLGQAIAYVITLPVRYVLGVSHWMAKLPFAAVYTESDFIIWWLVLCYVMLAAFFFLKKKRPMLLCGGVILSLVLSFAASCAEPMMDRYRISMLDVGQGQCILIQSKDKHYMIDCGSDYPISASDAAVQTLYSQGVTQLDGLILTHFDTDHISGVPELMSRIHTKAVYMPFIPEADNWYKQQVLNSDSDIALIRTDHQIVDDNIEIQLYPISTGNSQNKKGLCVLCRVEDCDILITGDLNTAAEQELLKRTQLPKLEILVIGHHGAADSTSLQLLQRTQPEYALISVGEDNRYHHPSYQTLEKLKMFDVTVRRTDLEGTILIRG